MEALEKLYAVRMFYEDAQKAGMRSRVPKPVDLVAPHDRGLTS
jgi:hypothetical protein